MLSRGSAQVSQQIIQFKDSEVISELELPLPGSTTSVVLLPSSRACETKLATYEIIDAHQLTEKSIIDVLVCKYRYGHAGRPEDLIEV